VRQRSIAFIFIALFALPLPARPSKHVIIFADVTSSLSPDEMGRVASTTSEIIGALPPETRVAVYTIQIDPDAPPLTEGTLPRRGSHVDERVAGQRQLQEIRQSVSTAIIQQYCSINFNDPATRTQCANLQFVPKPQDDLRSCILGRLGKASRKIADAREAGATDIEVIFVSDMIEECERTPLRRRIRLTRASVAEERNKVPRYPPMPDLSGARITIVVPRATESSVRATTPDMRDLRDDWQAVLAACGAQMSTWRFESELPGRLQMPARTSR
jgi:hypothetical protein